MTDDGWTGALCLDDPLRWISPDTLKEAAQDCLRCPVLDTCRAWAGGFKWHGVAIAGRVAPETGGLVTDGLEYALTCEHCGTEFTHHRMKRWCTRTCYKASLTAQRPNHEIPCRQCGALIVSRRPRHWCGSACWKAWKRREARESASVI